MSERRRSISLTATPRRVPAALLALVSILTMIVALSASAATGRVVRARQAFSPQCADSQYSALRDPRNPLGLARAPGSNPLNGASFFVDGPRHGPAASAIAQLLGQNPSSYPENYSWAQFRPLVDSARLQATFTGHPALAGELGQLEKIAGQPSALRFSSGAGGGGPGAIYGQVQKFFCAHGTADPGAIPIISTDFVYQIGYCETGGQILSTRANFDRQIDEMAAGIGRHPAVMLLEVDAIGTSACLQRNGALPDWEALLRYEIAKLHALPHTVLYLEAGYSDTNSAGYTAKVIKAVGVRQIRGFYTNDTHLNWTINEIRWGDRISALTGGLHFIVNTAANGHGPRLNPHPVYQGVEDLCNPPGRGLGPRPTTNTGFQHVDAFLWTGVPGLTNGCGPGQHGGFSVARALDLASHAQSKLGPGFPTNPY